MDNDIPDLMGLLARKMAYLNQKQSVHAENVANSSTPGYRAREVMPFNFDDALKTASSTIYTDDPRHIIPVSMAGTNAATVRVKGYDTTPDKNSVDSEQETMKSAQTAQEYTLITAIYKKLKGMYNIALKGSA